MYRGALFLILVTAALTGLPLYGSCSTEEIQIVFDSPNGIYSAGVVTQVKIQVVRASSVAAQKHVTLTVTNSLGKTINSQKGWITAQADGTFSIVFDVPVTETGYYEVKATVTPASDVQTAKSGFVILAPRSESGVPSENSIFGLSGGAIFHLPAESAAQVGTERLSKFPLLGCTWGRNDLWWGTIEPKQGQWDWSRADLTVKLFKDNGVQLLGILCYSSAWSGGKAPATADEVERFAAYVTATVSRYKDSIKHWEVWNEPNLAEFWSPEPNVSDYATLLKAAYSAAKSADPSAFILGGVTAGVDLRFLDSLFSMGALDFLDGISVHPYQAPWDAVPNAPLVRIPAVSDLCTKYASLPKPIWITEMGLSTEGGVSEQDQAQYLPKAMLTAASQRNVERVYWFNLTDWGPGGRFGLCRQDGTPKPSFLAFRQLLIAESGSRHQVMPELSSGVVVHKFSSPKARKQTLVLWSRKGTQKVSVRMVGLDALLTVQDYLGREVLRSKKVGESIRLTVGESPLYLFSKDPILVESL